MGEPLWVENPFAKEDNVIRNVFQLNIRYTSFGLAVFISNEHIAFRESNRIQIFSIVQNKVIHELRHGEEIRDFFLLNINTLMSFGYYNIYIWDVRSGRRVCKIKCNERSIPVYGDDENTFILCRHLGIDLVSMESEESSKRCSYRVLKTERFKSSTNRFISVRWAERFGDKIVIYKDDGLLLIHVSNARPKFKIIFKKKFLIDERLYYKDITTLNDKYLVHPEGQKVVIRDIQTFQKLRSSTNVAEIPFHDEANGRKFSVRLSNISLYRKVVLFHFYSADRNNDGEIKCYHAFIISSIESGEILFKHTMFTAKDTTLQKPQIDKRGLILNDGRIFILHLPIKVFEIAGTESTQSENEAPISIKQAYIRCLQDSIYSLKEIVEAYISYENCKVSVEEFYCAHRIIMLIAQGEWIGEEEQSILSRRNLEKLYRVMNELKNGSEEHRKILQNILAEAEDNGLISTGSINLSGTENREEKVQTKFRSFNLGAEVIDKLWEHQEPDENSSNVSAMKRKLERYSEKEGTTELFSLAIHLIPFLCGSKAYAIQVGSQIFDKWAMKDIGDRQLIHEENRKSKSPSTFEEDVIRFVGNMLSKQSLDLLAADHRERIKLILRQCDVGIESLMEIFLDWSKNISGRVSRNIEKNFNAEGEKQLDYFIRRTGIDDENCVSDHIALNDDD